MSAKVSASSARVQTQCQQPKGTRAKFVKASSRTGRNTLPGQAYALCVPGKLTHSQEHAQCVNLPTCAGPHAYTHTCTRVHTTRCAALCACLPHEVPGRQGELKSTSAVARLGVSSEDLHQLSSTHSAQSGSSAEQSNDSTNDEQYMHGSLGWQGRVRVSYSGLATTCQRLCRVQLQALRQFATLMHEHVHHLLLSGMLAGSD